jgi:hypothetical protein
VNFEGGNCWVVVTLKALHSYLFMKMSTEPPPPDLEPPPSPEDFHERFRIDPEKFKL